MDKKHKIIGLAILVGLPILLISSAPSPKKQIKMVSVSDTANVQIPSNLPSPDKAAQPPTTTEARNPTNTSMPTQTPVKAYGSTPAVSDTVVPKPVTSLAAPDTSPSVWVDTAGFLDSTYHYVITFVSATGHETGPSPSSLGVSPKIQRVWVNNIPTAADGNVSERNLYRTLANGSSIGPYYLVSSFYDNSTTYYYDNTSDDVLSASTPRYF